MFKFILLIHILGAIGLFAALAMQFAAMAGLRRSTSPSQGEAVLATVSKIKVILVPSMALLLLSGLYMMGIATQNNRPTGWMIVALISFVLIGILSNVASDKQTKELQKELLSPKDALSGDLMRKARDPRALTPLIYALGLALGIVVLMVFNPEVITSLIIMGVALVLCIGVVLSLGRRSATVK